MRRRREWFARTRSRNAAFIPAEKMKPRVQCKSWEVSICWWGDLNSGHHKICEIKPARNVFKDRFRLNDDCVCYGHARRPLSRGLRIYLSCPRHRRKFEKSPSEVLPIATRGTSQLGARSRKAVARIGAGHVHRRSWQCQKRMPANAGASGLLAAQSRPCSRHSTRSAAS
jgi:hypothetical protein